MALGIEQINPSRESRASHYFIVRATCDLCGCASTEFTIGLYRDDPYARHEAYSRAEGHGWIQRLGGERGNVLQAICPHCQMQE